jgi:hypothetical protein
MLGLALGLCFGYFLGGLDTGAGPLLFGLVIVPIVIWLSPKHPLLGWQLPIIAFAICSALTHPDYPGQPFDLPSDLLMAVLEWTVLLVFSSPWGLLLWVRAQQARSGAANSPGDVKRYALAVFLVIAGSLLVLIGWAMVFAPNSSAWDPAGGILIGTVGIAVWKYCDRVTSSLGKAREVARHFMQVALLFCPLLALGGGHSGGGQISGWSTIIFGSMLGIESLVALIWLSLTGRAARAGLPEGRSNS